MATQSRGGSAWLPRAGVGAHYQAAEFLGTKEEGEGDKEVAVGSFYVRELSTPRTVETSMNVQS